MENYKTVEPPLTGVPEGLCGAVFLTNLHQQWTANETSTFVAALSQWDCGVSLLPQHNLTGPNYTKPFTDRISNDLPHSVLREIAHHCG